MKTATTILSLLLFTSVAFAQDAQESKPAPTVAVCKADLKAWSASKKETLTIEAIMARMNEMYACADGSQHHRHSDKKISAYLTEFYRTHTELANRALDFIEDHGLKDQFTEEKNGTVADVDAKK
jgi:hypothetical protein